MNQDNDSTERTCHEPGLEHVGYMSHRTIWGHPSALLERSFSHEWLRQNREPEHFLTLLLESYFDDDGLDGRRIPVTERDAHVAATVIQWLGTNVGLSFLTRSLQAAGYKITPPDIS